MDRNEALDLLVSTAFAEGIALPAVRKLAAAKLGGTAKLYLGTVDPRYYRLLGLATPLPAPPASKPYVLASGLPSASLARAIRIRRDSGVRWNVLGASVEATIGRRLSEETIRALYERGGGDLDSSYTGRGTRVGAPSTYLDPAAEARGEAS